MVELNTEAAINRIGDAAIYSEIAQAFACHIPWYIVQITSFLETDAHEDASRIIHSVKSNCATVGAEGLRARLAAVEKIATQGKKEESLNSIENLRPELLELKALLEKMHFQPPL